MLIDNRPVKHTGSRQYHIILSKDISKIKSRRSFYKTFPRNTIRFDMFENIFLRREIKITPVMTQPYIIDIFQILPSPIQTGQFTISFILTAYIVPHIISLTAQINSGSRFTYLNRHINIVISYRTFLMGTDQDSYIMFFHHHFLLLPCVAHIQR